MKHILRIFVITIAALGISVAASSAAFAQGQPAGGQSAGAQPTAQQQPKQPPLTLKEVIHLVKKNKKHLETISPEVVSRGVDFDMTPEIQEQLLKAGATPEFVANVKNLGPTARAEMAASGAGAVSPEESQAFQAIQNELDPDRKIQEVSNYAAKYPNSPLLTYVYFLAEGAELQKNDVNAVLSYGEKSLALKPDNLNTLMLMTKLLPTPQSLQNDPNPDGKLDEAEKYGQKALELVNALTKVPTETDEAFANRKGHYLEGIHSGLAMVHFQRAMEGLAGVDQEELAKAESEYRAAIAAASDPSPEDYFRLGEVCGHENKIDDAIQAFTKVSEMSQDSPALKNLADQKIAALKSKKK
jgi:tetratricopeptide (TPR) repeat protein